MSGSNLETRSLLDELRSFDKGGFFDVGHPLLNRIAESFVKAAGIGAIQAVSREAYLTAVEIRHSPLTVMHMSIDGTMPYFQIQRGGLQDLSKLRMSLILFDGVNGDATTGSIPPETGASKRHHRFPDLRGESNRKSVEALVRSTGVESMQWGLAAGMYSGITYGLKEARGVHDWKNSLMAGAATGAALALTTGECSHEQLVQCAITGAAISTAANLLTGIF